MSEVTRYTADDLNIKSDEEIIDILKSEWGFGYKENIELVGNIKVAVTSSGSTLYFLENLKHPATFKALLYPLENFQSDNTIFIPPKEVEKYKRDGTEGSYFRCSVVLSDDEHRKRHKNPFELTALAGTVRRLEELPIPLSDLVIQDDEQGSILLEREAVEYLKKKHSSHIRADQKAAERELKQTRQEIVLQREQSAERLQSLSEELERISGERNDTAEEVIQLQTRIKEEADKLENLEETYSERMALMNEHMESLKRLIEEKGSKLVSLDLIDASDLNVMLGTKERERESGYDFSEDFDRDFNKAVSYIQAHLRQRNIYYTRSQLRNFWALLRTNDLIILAGDSGSGKTSLVKSFAGAIGGVAKIIPVKPNWTSSDDLLGYYNPIEKKYLSTEFLDALREASQNPDVPYLICLDEMNLARVEYYFADFLSKLEERSEEPRIHLYSSSELSDTLKDYRIFLNLVEEIQNAQPDKELDDFVSILKDDLANETLHKMCGFHEGDSLLRYHSYIRKQARGVIHTPTTITMPQNVRVIGAINIDETTHYLSPKILDRAHVVKFISPLLSDWGLIENEVEDFPGFDLSKSLNLEISDLGVREEYPPFAHDEPLTSKLVELSRDYLLKLGLDFGLRTVRQARYYHEQLSIFGVSEDVALNNIILNKVLPKMTFDGNKSVGDVDKSDLLYGFRTRMEELIDFDAIEDENPSAKKELSDILIRAESNDWIVNYWS